ncbi:MAG TPA: tail fiber protein [Paucimonas sp.]|nr:tail fiber protein [Paucimonas sp.]
MKNRPVRSVLSMAMACSLGTALVWSNDSHACTPEPYISAICIMAVPWTNLYGYTPANGATLPVNTNQALFSLIGFTYGGDGNSNFQLPDLRGRVVIGAGAGPGLPAYNVANKGGATTVTLTSSNVPLITHSHPVTSAAGGITVTTGLGNLAAITTLTGLSATASMSGVSGSVSGSALTLKGYSGTAGTGSANGAALATPTGPANKIYASNAPDVSMMSGSISGTAPVSFSGNPTVAISGTPTTTLSGAPSVSLSGTTGSAGAPASSPIGIMPPYLALNYFIATLGTYPSRD